MAGLSKAGQLQALFAALCASSAIPSGMQGGERSSWFEPTHQPTKLHLKAKIRTACRG